MKYVFHNKQLDFVKMSVHLSHLWQSTEILSTDGLLGADSLHTQHGMAQRPQNVMDENGNHGNRPHNSTEHNLSVSGCPTTCWLSR